MLCCSCEDEAFAAPKTKGVGAPAEGVPCAVEAVGVPKLNEGAVAVLPKGDVFDATVGAVGFENVNPVFVARSVLLAGPGLLNVNMGAGDGAGDVAPP